MTLYYGLRPCLQVTNVRAGSVVADVTFAAPDAATPEQMSELQIVVTSEPGEILMGSPLASKVLSVTVPSDDDEGGLSNAATLAIIIACSVGGAILVLGVGIWLARRRSSVAVQVMPTPSRAPAKLQ